MTIYLFATLDTKGPEAAFVAQRLRALGMQVELVDTGCLGEPTVAADIARIVMMSTRRRPRRSPMWLKKMPPSGRAK